MDPLTIVLIICTIGLISNLIRVLHRAQSSEDEIKIKNGPKARAVVPVVHE